MNSHSFTYFLLLFFSLLVHKSRNQQLKHIPSAVSSNHSDPTNHQAGTRDARVPGAPIDLTDAIDDMTQAHNLGEPSPRHPKVAKIIGKLEKTTSRDGRSFEKPKSQSEVPTKMKLPNSQNRIIQYGMSSSITPGITAVTPELCISNKSIPAFQFNFTSDIDEYVKDKITCNFGSNMSTIVKFQNSSNISASCDIPKQCFMSMAKNSNNTMVVNVEIKGNKSSSGSTQSNVIGTSQLTLYLFNESATISPFSTPGDEIIIRGVNIEKCLAISKVQVGGTDCRIQKKDPDSFSCTTNRSLLVPGMHEVELETSLGKSSSSGHCVFQSNAECGRKSDCGPCMENPSCLWIQQTAKCADEHTYIKHNSNHVSLPQNCTIGDARQCPSFHLVSPNHTVYVPAGEPFTIQLMASWWIDAKPMCQLVGEHGAPVITNTSWLHNSSSSSQKHPVRCDFGAHQITAMTQVLVPGLKYKIGSNWHSYKASPTTNVTVYQCEKLATGCSSCLALDNTSYSCGWCEVNRQCTLKSRCRSSSRNDSWKTDICHPYIEKIDPISGPLEGGTVISIHVRETKSKTYNVSIGNQVCDLQPVKPEVIECKTKPFNASHSNQTSAVVEVTTDTNTTITSNEKFNFVEPLVTKVTPSEVFGTESLLITVHGHHLNSGKSNKMLIDSKECNDAQTTVSNSKSCKYSRNSTPVGNITVSVTIDDWKSEKTISIHVHEQQNVTSAKDLTWLKEAHKLNTMVKTWEDAYFINNIQERYTFVYMNNESLMNSSIAAIDILVGGNVTNAILGGLRSIGKLSLTTGIRIRYTELLYRTNTRLPGSTIWTLLLESAMDNWISSRSPQVNESLNILHLGHTLAVIDTERVTKTISAFAEMFTSSAQYKTILRLKGGSAVIINELLEPLIHPHGRQNITFLSAAGKAMATSTSVSEKLVQLLSYKDAHGVEYSAFGNSTHVKMAMERLRWGIMINLKAIVDLIEYTIAHNNFTSRPEVAKNSFDRVFLRQIFLEDQSIPSIIESVLIALTDKALSWLVDSNHFEPFIDALRQVRNKSVDYVYSIGRHVGSTEITFSRKIVNWVLVSLSNTIVDCCPANSTTVINRESILDVFAGYGRKLGQLSSNNTEDVEWSAQFLKGFAFSVLELVDTDDDIRRTLGQMQALIDSGLFTATENGENAARSDVANDRHDLIQGLTVVLLDLLNGTINITIYTTVVSTTPTSSSGTTTLELLQPMSTSNATRSNATSYSTSNITNSETSTTAKTTTEIYTSGTSHSTHNFSVSSSASTQSMTTLKAALQNVTVMQNATSGNTSMSTSKQPASIGTQNLTSTTPETVVVVNISATARTLAANGTLVDLIDALLTEGVSNISDPNITAKNIEDASKLVDRIADKLIKHDPKNEKLYNIIKDIAKTSPTLKRKLAHMLRETGKSVDEAADKVFERIKESPALRNVLRELINNIVNNKLYTVPNGLADNIKAISKEITKYNKRKETDVKSIGKVFGSKMTDETIKALNSVNAAMAGWIGKTNRPRRQLTSATIAEIAAFAERIVQLAGLSSSLANMLKDIMEGIANGANDVAPSNSGINNAANGVQGTAGGASPPDLGKKAAENDFAGQGGAESSRLADLIKAGLQNLNNNPPGETSDPGGPDYWWIGVVVGGVVVLIVIIILVIVVLRRKKGKKDVQMHEQDFRKRSVSATAPAKSSAQRVPMESQIPLARSKSRMSLHGTNATQDYTTSTQQSQSMEPTQVTDSYTDDTESEDDGLQTLDDGSVLHIFSEVEHSEQHYMQSNEAVRKRRKKRIKRVDKAKKMEARKQKEIEDNKCKDDSMVKVPLDDQQQPPVITEDTAKETEAREDTQDAGPQIIIVQHDAPEKQEAGQTKDVNENVQIINEPNEATPVHHIENDNKNTQKTEVLVIADTENQAKPDAATKERSEHQLRDLSILKQTEHQQSHKSVRSVKPTATEAKQITNKSRIEQPKTNKVMERRMSDATQKSKSIFIRNTQGKEASQQAQTPIATEPTGQKEKPGVVKEGTVKEKPKGPVADSLYEYVKTVNPKKSSLTLFKIATPTQEAKTGQNQNHVDEDETTEAGFAKLAAKSEYKTD